MSEIIYHQVPHINSITPDVGRRIQRAKEITNKIQEIQEKSISQQDGNEHKDPFKVATELGLYDRLGVTVEEVKSSIQKDDNLELNNSSAE